MSEKFFKIYNMFWFVVAILSVGWILHLKNQQNQDSISLDHSFHSEIGDLAFGGSSQYVEFSYEKDGPPLGYCALENGQLIAKVYDYQIFCRDSLVTDGKNHVEAKSQIVFKPIDKAIDPKFRNKEFNLDVKDDKLAVNFSKKRFDFTPSLYFGLDANHVPFDSKTRVRPSLGISFISAGKEICRGSKGPCNSEWKLITLQAGYAFGKISKPSASIVPAMWNIGRLNKLTPNLYLAPNVGMTGKNFSFGLGFMASL